MLPGRAVLFPISSERGTGFVRLYLWGRRVDQGELIQHVSENPRQYAWFLGAGASQSANLPTAWDIIWDLKRRHYCRQENQQISSNDVQNVAVREKIDAYLATNGFPAGGDSEEYSRYFEIIFGSDHERQRRYLRGMLADDRVSLSVGHRTLAAMMSMQDARVVFTTNFDSVVEKAFAEVAGRDIAAFHLEGSYAANAALNNDEFPLYTKLHGDFRYESLKNLSGDLRTQDAELGKCLVNASNRFGLVVAGYSGRDASVMSLLQAALAGTNPFPHGLYWTALKGRAPLAPVTELLEAARANGVRGELVEIETFDSLLSRIWRQLPARPPALVAAVNKSALTKINIPLPPKGTGRPFLRLNALPVAELPTRCLQLQFTGEQERSDLRAAESRAAGGLIWTKEAAVWAWGHSTVIAKAFGAILKRTAEVEIGDRVKDLGTNTFIKAFLEEGIARALARGKPLLHRAHHSGSVLIVDRHSSDQDRFVGLKKCVGGAVHGTVPGLLTKPTLEHPEPEPLSWAEAVEIDLQAVDGSYWLVLKPDIWIWPRWARRDATDFLDKRSATRFNRVADALLSAWIALLLPAASHGSAHELTAFDGPPGASNPRFVIGDRTAFSRRPKA